MRPGLTRGSQCCIWMHCMVLHDRVCLKYAVVLGGSVHTPCVVRHRKRINVEFFFCSAAVSNPAYYQYVSKPASFQNFLERKNIKSYKVTVPKFFLDWTLHMPCKLQFCKPGSPATSQMNSLKIQRYNVTFSLVWWHTEWPSYGLKSSFESNILSFISRFTS